MLQVVIYNAKHKKLAIGEEKPAFEEEKPAFEEERLNIEKISSMLDSQNYNG